MSVVASKPKSQQPEPKRRAATSSPVLKGQRAPRINSRNKLDTAGFSGFG